jgi:hypothetical protein
LELLRELDHARDELYALVRTETANRLSVRPDPGTWSVVENVRHLLYAEERHIARICVDGFAYSPIGMPTNGQPRRNGAGTEATDDLEQVLSRWDEVHEQVRSALGSDDAAVRALERNLVHFRQHLRAIRGLLDAEAGS